MTTNDATPREADRAVPEPDADAVVDKVAAALANHAAEEGENWYVDDDGTEHFPKWEDLPDDDTYLGGGEWPNPGRNRFRKQARAALQAAAMPTVQFAAGDAEWLDTALDSVHPNAAVHVWLESQPEPDVGLPHYFMARLDVNGPDTSDPHYGAGPTRKAAVLDAVAKAKEQE